MNSRKKPILPEKSTGDYVHTFVKAGLGSIPIAGAAAAELFAAIVTPPLEKRRNKWMNDIGEQLRELEIDKQIDLSTLSDNDIFITTVMHASQIAVRNHSLEKIKALENAISNAALPNPPEESKELLFLHYIDIFTVWHLRILHLFQNSQNWFILNQKKPPEFSFTSSYEQVLLSAYPELENNRSLYDIIDRELNEAGFFSDGGIHSMMSSSGAYQKRTTEFGDEFLKFISTP